MSAPHAPAAPTTADERAEGAQDAAGSGQWLVHRLHEQRLQADRARLAALLAAHGGPRVPAQRT